MSAHHSAGRSHCQNCGSKLHGPFCSVCGQHDVDYHRSVWPILEDSLEGFLHLDGKFLLTVRWLFTRPGFLTNEFNAGKRTKYTQPLRLYIFASFLFFAFSVLFGNQPGVGVTAKPEATLSGGVLTSPTGNTKISDAEQVPKPIRKVVERLNRGDQKDIAREMQHLVPTMAFFCLPLLGAALLLAYRAQGRVYVEHMIFALHIQAFYFLTALVTETVQAGLRPLSKTLANLTGVLFFLGGAFLIYRAARTVYGEGPWKTLGKMLLVAGAYGIVLIIGIVVTSIAAALLAS
jgi:hypothetical protein